MQAELERGCLQGVLGPNLSLRNLSTVAALRSAYFPGAGLPGYTNNRHSLPLGSFDSFNHLAGSQGLPPQTPLCLCEGILELLPRAAAAAAATAAAEQGSWVGVGIRCGRWVVCLLAGQQSSSGPAPRPHVPGQAGF